MKRACVTLVLLLMTMNLAGAPPEKPGTGIGCPIIPIPKDYRDTGAALRLADPGAAAIVIGANAEEPEKYAAERFQFQVKRRTGLELPILTETGLRPEVKQVFLLGQRASSALVDEICERHKIDLAVGPEGHDGYVIEFLKKDAAGRRVILVGGANARGVLYGQYSLYDLLRKNGKGDPILPVVSVRDWSTIKWRSWWWADPQHELRPGLLDAYARARINQTQLAAPSDLRLPVSEAEKMALYADAVREFHRRGIFIYGMVGCAIGLDEHDAALKTCQQFIDMGLDGLYMRFDDAGPGADPIKLVSSIMELGARNGMTGERIAYLPPIGSYENADSSFNKKMLAVEGIRDIQWFLTTVPSARLGESIGRLNLSIKPGWWHNWPMTHIGFPIDRKGETWRSYYYRVLLPLKHGWGDPDFDEIRDADKYINVASVPIRPKPEYLTAELGHWAWDPERFDWEAFRLATYGYVFGRNQAEAVRDMDDAIAELRNLFRDRWRDWYDHVWALIDRDDKDKALALVDRAEARYVELMQHALADTSLDPLRCFDGYLEPMRAMLHFARVQSAIGFPEYVVAPKVKDRAETSEQILATRMSDWMLNGESDKAKAYLAEIAEEMTPLFAPFEQALEKSIFAKEYCDYWREVLQFEYWEKHVARQINATAVDIVRDAKGVVTITTNNEAAQLLYTVDGTDPVGTSEHYSQPFPFEKQGTIKVIAHFPSANMNSKVFERRLGIPKGDWKVAYVDSEELPAEAAVLAIDDNTNSHWITEWSKNRPDYPHEFVIDLGKTHNLAGFGYQSRKANWHGRMTTYEVYVSEDGKTWGEPAATGSFEFPDDNLWEYKEARFDRVAPGRFIRIVGLSEKDDKEWMCAAEFDVFEAE
ncbi:MAG TPA: discoidin domain-containing protein [Sumerlaeia bacterium]|nr:discoidin domain-containing protein [Sumerlaeia bacterium]